MHIRNVYLPDLPRNHREVNLLEIAPRTDGGNWQLPAMIVTGSKAGPILVVIAGVHGDEYEGVEAVPRVFKAVDAAVLSGTLVLLPVCNIPAYEAGLRCSPVDGFNLARVFPGDEQGPITEQIAYWITEKLLKHADFLIDLHSGGIAYNIPTLIGYIHDSGKLGQRSQAAAVAFGTPIRWGHQLPLPPGRSLSVATDLNVPSLYTEAPGGGFARAETVTHFAEGVLNVMKHLGMLEGAPRSHPVSHHLLGDGNLDSAISAPVAGYFRPAVALLDMVRSGDMLGTIQDLFGDTIAEVIADRNGVVIMLRRIPQVQAGDGLVHITGIFVGN